MEKVEWHDVQGLVLSGYPQLPFSAYVPWRLREGEGAAARTWLRSLAGQLMRAGPNDTDDDTPTDGAEDGRAGPHIRRLKGGGGGEVVREAVNIAFTASGLRAFCGTGGIAPFSLEFVEGMAPARDGAGRPSRRTNVLGDLGQSSPANWEWGGWGGNDAIDGLLMLFAPDATGLEALLARQLAAMAPVAVPLVAPDSGGPLVLPGRVFDDRTEHFGYRDGISQPIIEGSPKAHRHRDDAEARRVHFVKPGEFLFGYRNERRVRSGTDDLRRNGSYLVLRQLEQDVAAFSDFVARAAAALPDDEPDASKREWIAARLVGRCPDGRPLAAPADGTTAGDSEAAPEQDNDFLYYYNDRFGLRCPIGAHIRRANPRDTKGPDPDTALQLSKMHRLIRRGRMYGERFDPARPEDGGRRGILFMAFNADIAGQFEMIQHSWLNSRHFGDLHVGTDPIGHFADDDDAVVIQNRPVNIVVPRPKPFVRVRGGAYFFLPGIDAVRRLAG